MAQEKKQTNEKATNSQPNDPDLHERHLEMAAQTPATDFDTEEQMIGYERQDANPRGVALATLALFICIAIVLAVAGGLVGVFGRLQPQPTPVSLSQSTPPPPPDIWINPAAETQNELSQTQFDLYGYSWADQENGVVRIPITRAMQLLTERGLPARDQAPPRFRRNSLYRGENESGTGEDQNNAPSTP